MSKKINHDKDQKLSKGQTDKQGSHRLQSTSLEFEALTSLSMLVDHVEEVTTDQDKLAKALEVSKALIQKDGAMQGTDMGTPKKKQERQSDSAQLLEGSKTGAGGAGADTSGATSTAGELSTSEFLGVLGSNISDTSAVDTEEALAGVADADSGIIADENEVLATNIFNSQHESTSKNLHQRASIAAQNFLNKVDLGHVSSLSDDHLLHHASGKTFDLSEIFPDIKRLSALEQDRLNQDFLSGFDGTLSQLLNSRRLERMGGSEFGSVPLSTVEQIVKQYLEEIGLQNRENVEKLHQLFVDIPEKDALVEQLKRFEETEELPNFDPNHPVALLRFEKEYLAETGGDGLVDMYDTVCSAYMRHETNIAAAIKRYKFDPTTTEYQELVFYSYILASRSQKRANFEFYETLVQLQNQYLLFKICAGSFLKQGDFERLYDLNPKLERLSSYNNPYQVTDACMSHFLYLYDPLVYVLMCDAPTYLEFIDNLSRMAYQDTKQKYFSTGLPFNFAFVSPLRSYFSGLIVKFITQESLSVINKLDQDSERRPMMYYDIFFGQDNTSEVMMRRIPEFEKAMQEIGDKLKTAIKNNEITPAMQEWAGHIKHQQDIFKTLDLLGTDNFQIFSDPYLGHCSEIYHQYYYQQLAFYSKFSINLERKEQFIEQTASHLINLLKQGHYIEALSGELTKDACRAFQGMLAKRRGLFANVDLAEVAEAGSSVTYVSDTVSSSKTGVSDAQDDVVQETPAILSSNVPLSEHSALEQATACIGLSTLEVLRDGSTRQHHDHLLPAEMEILEHLRLTKSEFKTLKNLIRDGVRQLSFEHLPPMVSMNLERGQFIGDNGMIPVIPGTSAHSAFLIGRALHYGDFGLRNQQMARCALLYADLLGHYLATLFVVNLYGVLFDSTFNQQGKQYTAYLIRAVFAANLTAYSDEYLFAPQYFDVQMMLHPGEFYTDEEISEREAVKQEIENHLEKYYRFAEAELGGDASPDDKLKLRDFLEFINDDAQGLVDRSLYNGFNNQSRQLQRMLTVVKNKVAVYLSPEYGKTYYQSLADLSKEYLNLFKQLNPTFDLKRSDEGVPCYGINQFPVILSNALIYLVDLIGSNDRTLALYNNVLQALLHQLYAVMGRTQAPSGSLALYSFLSSLFLVNAAQDDSSLQYYFNMDRLSKILYVQLLSSVGSSAEFSNSCNELDDFSVIANIFLQLGMCISDLREQGYNLLDRKLASNMGNFTPSQAPYLDEFYKSSAALHNGNSLSYLTAVNHQLDNHEQAELFALLGNLSHSLKTYRDVVRYCIKYELHDLRLAVAQNMVLMRQPYAYYEMYLCCKDLPERQMEAHTYLYFAALMSVAEAKQDLKELQDSQLFKPLPFLVYFLYLQEQAKTNLSALLCMMMLSVDNSVVPSCFSEYVKMLDLYQGTFSNAQLKQILLKYGVLNKANISPFMTFSSFYSMFPDTEYEANNSIVEAMNGNFAELNENLSELDFRYLSVSGQLDLEMCDAQVRVLLTKMFEKLTQGKSMLESLIAASWSHSQSFPPFLKEKFKDYIDAPFVISSSMDLSVMEVLNNWLSNSLDPYNDTIERAWCLALPHDRTRRKEVESLCETLWLNNNTTPSRNLMLGAALVSMRSVVGRPYPRLFRALCRYLANSGQADARRYVQMDWDFMGIAPYGDIFELKIGRPRRQLICKMSRRQSGKTLLQVQDIALQEQYSQYIKQHKPSTDLKDPQTSYQTEQGGDEKQNQHSSGSSSSSKKQSLGSTGEQLYHQDEDGVFGQVNLELTDNFEATKQGRMWNDSDTPSSLSESLAIKLDPEHSLPTETLLQNRATVSLGDPGTWISSDLYGSNELLNYTYFMMLHSHCGMLAGLLCIKNGWMLGRKANSPMRSYSSYLARSLLKNETGAFHRYLYYVQSHYFRYHLNSFFRGEDNKTLTARKFVNEVLQLNINSPKFQQFLEGMRNEGVFDFDGLVDSARNGYVQGSYKFCIEPESEMDTVGGWRNLFFDEHAEYNLSVDEAVAARESLKFLATKIDRLSEMSLGNNLDEATINRLKYGTPVKDKTSGSEAIGADTSDDSSELQLQGLESKQDIVGVVGFGDEFTKTSSDYGEAKIRMKYGSIAVTKELLKDPVLTKFLGREVSRIKDATLSKQWINYTFYQEPHSKDRRDLLQMLPYTNSILEQCICDNVGQGLMSASRSRLGSGGPVSGISYEPRLVQWRSSKLRIRQEESFDPHKVSPELLLQSLDHTYDNALYQINRTRFHMLRQAQVEPSSVNATIEAQANWATMLSKQADLRSHGAELLGDEMGRGESSWQNTLITEDGYDALLEKRLLQACFNHSKIADETFYVSEQNYYKELLHKVASAVKSNPQLLKRTGVLGVLLENTDPKQKRSLDAGRVLKNLKDGDLDSVLRMMEEVQAHTQRQETAQDGEPSGSQQAGGSNTLTSSGAASLADVLKAVSSATEGSAGRASAEDKLAADVAAATMDSDSLAREAAEDAKTLDAFSKFIAASHIGEADTFTEEHHHDKIPRDEVINETRSNEANLLNHLQLFLSDKMGVVPQFEGVVNAEKIPLVRDELDQPSSVLSVCFKNVWHFDEGLEQQYTRPKMFHEDDNPLHALIYSIVQAYVYDEAFDNQVNFSINLLNRLFNVYEYFYGACDVVDSSFAYVVLECYMRRYYRCTVERNRQQRVHERVREFLAANTDDTYIRDILLNYAIDLNNMPPELLGYFDFGDDEASIEEQVQNCIAKQFRRDVIADPHSAVLALATREQVKNYHQKLLRDDSFISQAMFNFLKDPELMEYSEAVNGDTGNSIFYHAHRNIEQCMRRKLKMPCAPLPLLHSALCIDYSQFKVNEEKDGLIRRTERQVNELDYIMFSSVDGVDNLETCERGDLRYLTDFEQQMQQHLSEGETDAVAYSASGQEEISEFGDNYCPKMPLRLFEHIKDHGETQLLPVEYEQQDDADEQEAMAMLQGLSEQILEVPELNAILAEVVREQGDGRFSIDMLNIALNKAYEAGYLDLEDDDDDDDDDGDVEFVGIKFLSDLSELDDLDDLDFDDADEDDDEGKWYIDVPQASISDPDQAKHGESKQGKNNANRGKGNANHGKTQQGKNNANQGKPHHGKRRNNRNGGCKQ